MVTTAMKSFSEVKLTFENGTKEHFKREFSPRELLSLLQEVLIFSLTGSLVKVLYFVPNCD